MTFNDLVLGMDRALLNTFSSGLTFILRYQGGSPDAVVKAVMRNPAMDEDHVPGSVDGVSVLNLFIRFTDYPLLKQGDIATVNGINYDIFNASPDREGGAVLKLRRRSLPIFGGKTMDQVLNMDDVLTMDTLAESVGGGSGSGGGSLLMDGVLNIDNVVTMDTLEET